MEGSAAQIASAGGRWPRRFVMRRSLYRIAMSVSTLAFAVVIANGVKW